MLCVKTETGPDVTFGSEDDANIVVWLLLSFVTENRPT
jgi:hypothetical protein